jgi:hypothetical protein
MSDDFTIQAYRQLLDALVQSRRPVGGVEDWLEGTLDPRTAVILRHDVDRRAVKAVRMAEMEHRCGIRGTYYFRTGAYGFPAGAIRAIAACGHAVGYHYETLSQCGGDRAAALRLFSRNLEVFRALADCRTVCMHGAPFSRYDNRELLAGGQWRTFGLQGDAVHSFAGGAMDYLTDTGGRWTSGFKTTRRDGLAGSVGEGRRDPISTTAVLERVKQGAPVLYLNVHPERWAWDPWDGLVCRLSDMFAGIAKAAITRHLS